MYENMDKLFICLFELFMFFYPCESEKYKQKIKRVLSYGNTASLFNRKMNWKSIRIFIWKNNTYGHN